MAKLPAELKYATTHEWVRREADGSITVGITEHAQESLGDLVFVQLPEVGKTYAAKVELAVVESVKTAADVHAPVSGSVTAVNQAVVDAPETVNEDPYGAWLFKMTPADSAEVDTLLDAAGYQTVVDAG